MGSWKAALGASAVLAAGAGSLAVPAAGATVSPVERASATAVAILSPAGHDAGIPTLFAWEAPVRSGGTWPPCGLCCGRPMVLCAMVGDFFGAVWLVHDTPSQ